jgi:hypothetical protein
VIGIEKKINWKKLNIRNIQNYKQEETTETYIPTTETYISNLMDTFLEYPSPGS